MLEKLLIFGGSGLLGSHATLYFEKIGFDVYSVYNKHSNFPNKKNEIQLNVMDQSGLWNLLSTLSPDVVLNCSGLTSVEDCEAHPEQAKFLHETFPETLARYTANNTSKYIHISTDHLWEGERSFYKETDPTNPINVYGKTKAKGEQLVLTENPSSLVIRTNFFGNGLNWRQSFSDWVIEKLKLNEKFYGYNDIYYTPISIPYLLEFLNRVLELDCNGTFNIAGSERVSKYHFIKKFADLMQFSSDHLEVSRYIDNPAKIPRPMDMSLDTTKLSKAIGLIPPNIEESIRSILI